MPDVETTCDHCGSAFKTKRGLAIHRTRAGHPSKAKAQALREALGRTRTSARPIPCTYPGCGASFGSKRGLTIHRKLMGHGNVHDSVERGDGPRDVPTHPALRPKGDELGMMDGPTQCDGPMPCGACGKQMSAGDVAYPSDCGPVCGDCAGQQGPPKD